MDKKTLESLAEDALDSFWKSVARRYPEAKTGDLSPLTAMKLDQAAENAIQEWVRCNVSIRCKTCGSEIVEDANGSSFIGGECGGCEYDRYRSQPRLFAALNALFWSHALHDSEVPEQLWEKVVGAIEEAERIGFPQKRG